MTTSDGGRVLFSFEGKDVFGSTLAEMRILEEGVNREYATYSVQYVYHNGEETCIKQRSFTVPRWQSLNIMGILAAALEQLDYMDICSDEWPLDQWKREQGSGSAVSEGYVKRSRRM